MMGTIQNLEIILARIKHSPLNIARTEIEMFHRTLARDPIFFGVIDKVIQTEQEVLGSKAATLAKDTNSVWADLSFANTPALRAVVGYQVCVCLLEAYRRPDEFNSRLLTLGSYYFAHQGLNVQNRSYLDCIKVFAEVFLEPLVVYLRSGLDIEERVLSLLSRYKQRCEWFGLDLTARAKDEDDNSELEKRLKKDILRYLFDNGIDFSVESQIPAGGGKVDILPVLRDWGQLPIEVKVFDGKSRSRQYVSSGLAQAADYARKFNKSSAYYVVFNVKADSILLIPGSAIGQNAVITTVQGMTIYSLVCNLAIKLPSSEAAKLERIEVPIPI